MEGHKLTTKSTFPKASIVCCILLFVCSNLSYGLYEDQVGKFDWRQMYVGHVKFAEFDTISNVKKVLVASEENVIAVLNLKSGNIIWRQVLEKKEQGTIHFMNLTSEAVITVSGHKPVNVRGWDLNGGFLLWDWSFPPTFSIKSENNDKWLLSDEESKLYHVYLGNETFVEIFDLESGSMIQTVPLNLPSSSSTRRCSVASPYIVCVQNIESTKALKVPNLITANIISEARSIKNNLLQNLPGVSDINVKNVHGNQPLVAVSSSTSAMQYIFLIKDEGPKLLPYKVESKATLVQDSLQDSNILLQAVHSKEWLDVRACNVATGEPVPDVATNLTYSHDNLGHPTLLAAVCTPRKDKGLGCRVIFNTEDHTVGMFHYPGKLMWIREEALASIVAVEMLDLPVSDTEAAIEKEFDHKETGFGGMFAHRLISQTLQLRLLFLSLMGLGDPPSAGQRAGLVRDEFGLHKMIVVATKVGKLFGIDNLSGDILWRKRLENVAVYSSQNQMILYVQRTTRHFPYPAQCALLAREKTTGEGIIFSFNPVSGQPISPDDPKGVGFQIMQSMLMPYPDENFLRGLILLDENENVHVFPRSVQNIVVENAATTFIFTADRNTGVLVGYSLMFSSVEELKATRVWEVKLSQGKQKLVAVVGKSPVERVHSQGRVLGDRSVLYKYINPNLVAVITQGFDPVHKNVVSGAVVFSVSHKRARDPVHIVHSENWVLYSYFSEKSRRTEIVTLELYEGKVQSNTTAFSSVASPIQPIVDQQAYILPGNVVAMKETITEKGITSKHILVALANGGVLELPWMFVDPRRPITVTPEMREEGVIPYMPELPVPSESIINYNQTVQRVHGIHTTPSGLESTCLVLVYGLDLFYTRVAPSKTFDVLKEDFDHFLITAVLLGLTVASYVTKKLASRKALKQAWK